MRYFTKVNSRIGFWSRWQPLTLSLPASPNLFKLGSFGTAKAGSNSRRLLTKFPILEFTSVCFLFFFPLLLLSEETSYLFRGSHFIASYLGCNKALADNDAIEKKMQEAIKASGATLLDQASYRFSPEGFTAVYLLSESHASIHTYPEQGSCFVDLFTCGDHCSYEEFDAILRHFLEPKEVEMRILQRGETISYVPKP